MKSLWRKNGAYIISGSAALAIGVLSAIFAGGKMEEYAALRQPPLAPPGWLCPVVWTALYILMGISAARVWKTGSAERGDTLFLYGTQLIVNLLWTIFFFGFGARLLAFFWLLFLLLLVAVMTARFRQLDAPAAKMQIPYVVWLVFAAYLNFGVYLLNR